ncbi:MAG: hypothetical protein FMNOHCHN_03767 [Ignavibacteriaceae bacterium]|nr:hypothetical protein [Ignavibacteriaceae bacterium]
MLKPGINLNVSNKDYHGDREYLSSSNLKQLLKNPEQFYKERILGQVEDKPPSTALEEGSYVHSLILEPHKVQEEYAFWKGLRKQGEDFLAFKSQNAGKIIISNPQKIRCNAYVDAYKKNPVAPSLLEEAEVEYTICTELNGVKIKIRCDIINLKKNYIADVKTSSFAVDAETFKVSMLKFGYDLSAALYVMVASKVLNVPMDFYFIAIDKEMMNCEVLKLSEKTLQSGIAQVNKALEIYKKNMETGIWSNEQAPVVEETKQYEIMEV